MPMPRMPWRLALLGAAALFAAACGEESKAARPEPTPESKPVETAPALPEINPPEQPPAKPEETKPAPAPEIPREPGEMEEKPAGGGEKPQ